MKKHSEEIRALAREVRLRRQALGHVRICFHNGQASYDDLAAAGREFCAAFGRWHEAHYGKPKLLDYRAVIR